MSPRHPRTQNRHIPECFEYTEVKARDIIIQYGLHDTGDSQEHAHDDYQILILPESTGEAELLWQSAAGGQCRRQICGPHICTIGKRVAHTVHWKRKAALVALRVSENLVMRNGGAEAMCGVIIRPELEYAYENIEIRHFNGHLGKLCRTFETAPRDYAHGMGLAQASQIILALSRPLADKRIPGLDSMQMEKIDEYIKAHLDEAIRVEELANIIKLGKEQFTRRFKQATGKTPYQYILEFRVREAQQLMAKGNMYLCDIAATVGFSDQSHLKRCLRRICGKIAKNPLLS